MRIRRETCLILSYITAKSAREMDTVVSNPEFIAKIIALAQKDSLAVAIFVSKEPLIVFPD